MAEIKENLLDIDLTIVAGEYLRKVNSDGDSVRIDFDKVVWPIDQVTDLQTALDAKMALSALKSQYGYIDATGQIVGTKRYKGTFSSLAELDTLFNGDYSLVNATAGWASAIGTAISVQAWDDSDLTTARTQGIQVVQTTTGMYYRVSDDGSTWSNFRYIGGSYSNQSFARTDLITLATPVGGVGGLTPGTLYKITDHGNDNGIIIQAAT